MIHNRENMIAIRRMQNAEIEHIAEIDRSVREQM
jgi:hypothetical protein